MTKNVIIIPKGRLANADAEKRNKELARKLLNGEKVKIGKKGSVTGKDEDATITAPPGILALNQWYENMPNLLEDEIEAMERAFPDFDLQKLEDGRLAWTGSLNIGVLGDNEWEVAAIYQNNHPTQTMGSSIHVHLIQPDIESIIEDLGWAPQHLLRSDDGLYLCTARADDTSVGTVTTTAASTLAWAVKWLMAFELVLTGDLSQEKFNQHNGI
ncbi:MAG: hypothetical protein LBD59_12535 [Prevotellaceae bacterium]|jgi:hypothetical protein|nr:hypothetical protein [Prevotellaceae bacterium]